MSCYFSIFFLFFLPLRLLALGNSNWVGISQGISSPSLTSTINFSNGFTFENPVGVIYQPTIRFSLEGDSGNTSGSDTKGLGGELGIGNGAFGVAAGYYDRDCNNCEGTFSGAVGVSFWDFGLGLRFTENIYGAGLMINPQGKHRFGVVAEINDPDGENNNIESFGVGYSYAGSMASLSIDASRTNFENTSLKDTTLISPGLALHFKPLTFSITYDRYLEDDPSRNEDDNLWFGIGFGNKSSWYVTVYHDYVNEWSASASFFF